jgi:uncharacterized membrane protein
MLIFIGAAAHGATLECERTESNPWSASLDIGKRTLKLSTNPMGRPDWLVNVALHEAPNTVDYSHFVVQSTYTTLVVDKTSRCSDPRTGLPYTHSAVLIHAGLVLLGCCTIAP